MRLPILFLISIGSCCAQATNSISSSPYTGLVGAFGYTGANQNAAGWASYNGTNGVTTQYPLGTIFHENFGNVPRGSTCWAGDATSSCQQKWYIETGSAPTISAGIAGFPGNALVLAPGATKTGMRTMGTIPTLAAATAYSVSFDFEYNSIANSGSVTPLVIYNSSNDQVCSMYSAGNNSGKFYFKTTLVTLAINTHYWITFNINGAASTVFVNGVQVGAAFTCSTTIPTQAIYLSGDTTGATYYFSSLIISAPSLGGGFPPSGFSDWAGQSGTADATKLAAGTHCGSPTWTYSAGAGITFSFDGTQYINSPQTPACGVNYSGQSGVSLNINWGATGGYGTFWTVSMPTTQQGIGVGFYWKTDVTAQELHDVGPTGATLNFFTLAVAGGSGYLSDHICLGLDGNSCVSEGTMMNLCLESTNYGCSHFYNIAPDTWYYKVLYAHANGNGEEWIWTTNADGSLNALVAHFLSTGAINAISGNTTGSFEFGDTGQNPHIPMNVWIANVQYFVNGSPIVGVTPPTNR